MTPTSTPLQPQQGDGTAKVVSIGEAGAVTPPAGSGRPKAGEATASRAFTEGFRLLALNVQRLLEGERRRSILVLSASPKEGRSLAAANLAKSLAEIAPPVVLIDADPEGSGLNGIRPEIREELWTGPGERPILQVVAPWFRSGTPERFLERVNAIIEEAADGGATVVVDAPACTTSSAGFYLATSVTGVLYVARRRRLKEGAVHADVRAQLELLGAHVLGVVINEG